mgnify:CR=1 FL=1
MWIRWADLPAWGNGERRIPFPEDKGRPERFHLEPRLRGRILWLMEERNQLREQSQGGLSNRPPFSKSLLWDVSEDSIDWEKHRGFVIGRVLNRGKWSDWQTLKQLYPLDVIREEVIRIPDLSPKAIAFCAAVLGLRKNQFRCQTTSPS